MQSLVSVFMDNIDHCLGYSEAAGAEDPKVESVGGYLCHLGAQLYHRPPAHHCH